MPLLYGSPQTHTSQNIYANFVEAYDFTMSRDGQVCPVVVLSELATSGDTYTLLVETFDGSNDSLGSRVYTTVKNPSGIGQYRLQYDETIFLPSGFRINVKVKATNSGDTGVTCVGYLFDPNCASDVIAVEGQSLGSKVGDNFNVLFQNGGNDSTKVLADLATPADVNAQVLDVVNVDTLIDGKTIVEAFKIIAAVVAGKVSGAGTGSEVFRSLNDSANRASVTVDAEGNRTAVTYS